MTSGAGLDYEPAFVIADQHEERFGSVAYGKGWLRDGDREVEPNAARPQPFHPPVVPVTQTLAHPDPAVAQSAIQRSLRDTLFAMEADLRTLHGVIAACRIFSQSADPIEPAALAVLVATASPAADQLLAAWRGLLEADP